MNELYTPNVTNHKDCGWSYVRGQTTGADHTGQYLLEVRMFNGNEHVVNDMVLLEHGYSGGFETRGEARRIVGELSEKLNIHGLMTDGQGILSSIVARPRK